MEYTFENQAIDREGRSHKWQKMFAFKAVDEDVIPFTVAEMEWETAPEIREGLKSYIDRQILGYTFANDAYMDAVISWHRRHHKITLLPEHIVPTPGVMSALSKLILLLSEKQQGIILLTPSYQSFYSIITLTERTIVSVPLINTQGIYTLDKEALEKAFKDPNNAFMILSNPHNPVGRSWTDAELREIAALSKQYGKPVISDEIHADLTLPGYTHNSYHHYDDQAIICTAASKAFNLAGLKASNIFIFDNALRVRFKNYAAKTGSDGVNALGLYATQLAYTQAEPWLNAAILEIYRNEQTMRNLLKDTEIIISPLEATYLLWLDLRVYAAKCDDLMDLLRQEGNLFFNDGKISGEGGQGFIRMNLAGPHHYIAKAGKRLLEIINKL